MMFRCQLQDIFIVQVFLISGPRIHAVGLRGLPMEAYALAMMFS